jgi:hypothetical protein
MIAHPAGPAFYRAWFKKLRRSLLISWLISCCPQ